MRLILVVQPNEEMWADVLDAMHDFHWQVILITLSALLQLKLIL